MLTGTSLMTGATGLPVGWPKTGGEGNYIASSLPAGSAFHIVARKYTRDLVHFCDSFGIASNTSCYQGSTAFFWLLRPTQSHPVMSPVLYIPGDGLFSQIRSLWNRFGTNSPHNTGNFSCIFQALENSDLMSSVPRH